MTHVLPARVLGFLLPMGHFAVDTPGGALFIIAPAIGVLWDLSPAAVGFIITAHQLGAGLGYFPAGIMGDRFRRRGLVLSMTLAWAALGYLAASVSPNYGVLVALLFVAGMGDAAWHPTAAITMVAQMPGRRALALGLHLTGGILAEVVGPLTAGFLLGVMDWRPVFQIAVIPAVAMALLVLTLSRRFPEAEESAITWAGVREVMAPWLKPRGVVLFLVVAPYNVAYIALIAMTPLFLLDHHGFSTGSVGVVFAGMLLAGGLTAPVMGRISDEWGRRPIAIVASLLGAGGALLVGFSANPVLLIMGAVIAAGVLTGVRPPLLAAALELTGRRESTSLGLVYALMDGVGALGALLAGLAGSVDLRYALVFAAGASSISALAALAAAFPRATRADALDPRAAA